MADDASSKNLDLILILDGNNYKALDVQMKSSIISFNTSRLRTLIYILYDSG